MTIQIELLSMPTNTQFVPLGVLGYCLTHTHFLDVLFADLELKQKKVEHEPVAKLQDILVSILAGCRAIASINTTLRPDVALAQAWGRKQFAEQSNLSRMLDSLTLHHIQQLQAGSESLFRRESYTLRHDLSQEWLWLDIDLTPLPISKRAEASTKGKMGDKKTPMVANWAG